MNVDKLTPMSRKIYQLLEAEGVTERDAAMVIRNCCQNITSALSTTVDVNAAQLNTLQTIVWFNAERRSDSFGEWGQRFTVFMGMNRYVKLDDLHTLSVELGAIDALLDNPATVNATIRNRGRGPKFFFAGNTTLQPRVTKPGDRSRARVSVVGNVAADHALLIDLKSFVRDLRRACAEAIGKRVGVNLEVDMDAEAGEGWRFGKNKLPAWSADWDHNDGL